ncbi:MAG: ion transporter [Holosporales bacterium]
MTLKKIEKTLFGARLYWLNVALIIVNAVCIGHVVLLPDQDTQFYLHAHHLIFAFFVAETLARVAVRRLRYFHGLENLFTLLILALCFLTDKYEFSLLFSFRLIKTMRRLNLLPKTQSLLEALVKSLPSVVNVIALVMLCYSVYGILGVFLFAQKAPELFGTFGDSLITLSQIMLGDDWGNNMRAIKGDAFYPLYCVSFLIAVAMLLWNAVVGVLADAIQSANQQDQSAKSD